MKFVDIQNRYNKAWNAEVVQAYDRIKKLMTLVEATIITKPDVLAQKTELLADLIRQYCDKVSYLGATLIQEFPFLIKQLTFEDGIKTRDYLITTLEEIRADMREFKQYGLLTEEARSTIHQTMDNLLADYNKLREDLVLQSENQYRPSEISYKDISGTFFGQIKEFQDELIANNYLSSDNLTI